MKILLILLFLTWFPANLCAQSSGDIHQDTSLANTYFQQALLKSVDDSTAYPLLHQAIERYETHPFQEELVVLKGYLAYRYALVYREDCIQLANEAIELAQKHLGDDTHAATKYAYLALMSIRYEANYLLGIEYGEKSLAMVEKPSGEYFLTLKALVFANVYSKNDQRAADLLEEMEQALAADNHQHFAEYWLDLYRSKMQFYMNSNNLEKALIFGNKFLDENEKYQRYTGVLLGPIYMEIAITYGKLKQLEKSIIWIDKALNAASSIKNQPNYGTYFLNIAIIYYHNNDIRKAIEYTQKAIDLMKDSPDFNNVMPIIYSNQANYYNDIKDYENAAVIIKKCYEYTDAFYIDINYASILYHQEVYDSALVYYQKALHKLCPSFTDTNVDKTPKWTDSFSNEDWAYKALYGKSVSFFHKGKQEKSIIYLQLSLETAEATNNLQRKISATMKGQTTSQFLYNKGIFTNLMTMIYAAQELYQLTNDQKYLEYILEYSEKRKAMLLLKELTPSPLPESVAAEEDRLFKDIAYYEQQITVGSADSIDFYQNQLFATNQEMDVFFKNLRQNYPKQTSVLYKLDYASSEDIQQELDENALYINYSLDGVIIVINVVGKNTHAVYQSEFSTLSDDIAQIQDLLNNPFLNQTKNREKFVEVSHRLYQQLIAPFADQLAGKSTLMIVPESKLFYLPFEILLPNDEELSFSDMDFLIKNYSINYHYSATAFHQLKVKKSPQDNSLLAFAPVFADGQLLGEATRSMDFLSDSLYRGIENDRFVPLLNSEIEVTKIAELFPSEKVNILLKEDASAANLINSLKNSSYQFIQIATHGLVNYKDPKLSALACYQTEKEENGFLFASEIQQLNINVDLVVLSSCESGIGGLSFGDGLLALNRSFVYAGAKNVLFSLWKVNDQYSSELMIDFYKSYHEGHNYTDALRQAKLKMLSDSKTASPRYWAAFVLIGE